MNERRIPYSLETARVAYLAKEPGLQGHGGALDALGYNLEQRRALYQLWESDRDAMNSEREAWAQACDLRQRAADLVQCNPVFLLLDAIRDNLVVLEDRIHAILSYLAPYPLHHPDSITPAGVTNIRQSLTTLTVTGLPHHRLVLSSLERRLQYTENVLHEFGPAQADDTDADGPTQRYLGDYIDDDDSAD